MTRPLIILGAGGSACDVLDILEAMTAQSATWTMTGFLDDVRAPGSEHLGYKVLGRLSDAAKFPDCCFVNAIGSGKTYRQRPVIIAATGLTEQQYVTLVHPTTCISRRMRLGRGVCVNAGVSVGGGVTIGDHVWLGPGVIVGHDTVIEDYAVVGPGAVISGFVRVGVASYIGAGACIREYLSIGGQALVGMGAVVVRDVEPGETVVGNPARLLAQFPEQTLTDPRARQTVRAGPVAPP